VTLGFAPGFSAAVAAPATISISPIHGSESAVALDWDGDRVEGTVSTRQANSLSKTVCSAAYCHELKLNVTFRQASAVEWTVAVSADRSGVAPSGANAASSLVTEGKVSSSLGLHRDVQPVLEGTCDNFCPLSPPS
jgi:hypothetical protein